MKRYLVRVVLFLFLGAPAYAGGRMRHVPTFGDVPEECVHEVRSGTRILEDHQSVINPDGTRVKYDPCSQKIDLTAIKDRRHKSKSSTAVPSQATNPAPAGTNIEHSWIEAGWLNGTNFTSFSGNWNVPAPPALTTDPISGLPTTIYLFPSTESSNDNCIIQPVLGFNGPVTNTWSIASWYGCGSGPYFYSSPVQVNNGDSISGSMTLNAATGNWTIITQDMTKTGSAPTSMTVNQTNVDGAQDSAQAALEVYNVGSCANYPASGPVAFTNLSIAANYGTPYAPTMPAGYWDSEGCGEIVVTSPGDVDLYSSPPVVTAVTSYSYASINSAVSGSGDIGLILWGTGFSQGIANNTVTFGSQALTLTYADCTSGTCQIHNQWNPGKKDAVRLVPAQGRIPNPRDYKPAHRHRSRAANRQSP